MVRKIRGVLKKTIEKDKQMSKAGYKKIWEMGRAANAKKRQRLFGPNRPST